MRAIALAVSAPAYAGKSECYLKPGAYWTRDEATLDMLAQVIWDGDEAALKAMIESPAVLVAKGDSRVYGVSGRKRERKVPGASFTFRFAGAWTVFWTFEYAVTCQPSR